MSSLTNMAIAIDRYRFIVKSQSLQVSTVGAALVYPVIVIISLLLAFPIAYKTKLVPMKQLLVSSLLDMNITNVFKKSLIKVPIQSSVFY